MIWRLLASVVVLASPGRRQQQIMNHGQAMNDSKNKTGTLRFFQRIYFMPIGEGAVRK